MFDTNTTTNSTTGTTLISNTSSINTDYTILNGSGTSSGFSTNFIFNPQTIIMKTKNAKVAIFSVKRNKSDNSIKSSKFIKELWVEVPANISLDLIVAKELGEIFDPLTTVIREIYSVIV